MNTTELLLILALICAGAGGVIAATQRAWAVVLVAVAVVLAVLPRIIN